MRSISADQVKDIFHFLFFIGSAPLERFSPVLPAESRPGWIWTSLTKFQMEMRNAKMPYENVFVPLRPASRFRLLTTDPLRTLLGAKGGTRTPTPFGTRS